MFIVANGSGSGLPTIMTKTTCVGVSLVILCALVHILVPPSSCMCAYRSTPHNIVTWVLGGSLGLLAIVTCGFELN